MTTGAGDTSGAGGQSGTGATQTQQTGGAPTHVTQVQQTGHQSMSGDQGNGQSQSGTGNQTSGTDNNNQSSSTQTTQQQTTTGDTKPDNAAMRAYLTEKAKDVSLEGKTEADIAQLYADTKAKEGQTTTEFKIPEKYKDKGWAAKVKSMDDVFQQLDTLDALKGKKSVVPDLKSATPEEREAFYAQMRGKDAAEYAIPENPAFPTPPETQTVVADLFSKNGVSPVQAQEIIKGYQELGAKQLKAQFDPDGFKQSMQTAFGNDWEKVTGQVRNTIKGMMNPDDQKQLDAIPNSLLGVVYRTLGNVVKRYGIKETDSAHFQSSGKAAPTDVGSVRQGLRDQLAALSMRPHTAMEQQAIIEQLNATYTNDPRIVNAQ